MLGAVRFLAVGARDRFNNAASGRRRDPGKTDGTSDPRYRNQSFSVSVLLASVYLVSVDHRSSSGEGACAD